MFSIGIHYLNGWAMATHPADREKAEWPPHPDRVFMALAAAHFETEGDERERGALEWLERQSPPIVVASPARSPESVTTFVPVNDTSSPIKKHKPLMSAGSLVIGRDRQPRQFPVAIPDNPVVHLLWRDAQPSPDQSTALASLAGKVTAVGHSASMVQMWVADQFEVPPTVPNLNNRQILRPLNDDGSRHRLRIFCPGRLTQLRSRFDAGLRPAGSVWQGYSPAMVIADRTEIPSPYLAQSLIILRQIEGRSFGLESTLLLTKALRDTIMSMSPVQPPPEWVSGHQADGKRSERTAGHLAFVPLPHVGRKHADGHVLGLAVAVPSDITQSEIARCLGAFLFDDAGWPKQIRLVLGKLGQCVLELDEGQAYRHALRSETWTGPSRRWATVTPIAIDRHAKFDDPHSQIERSIADGCERIGLPQPQDVIAAPVSMFIGSPHTRQMPRIQRKTDDGMIRQTHAVITFPCAVHGPVLLGAGRYRGYGLCRPLAVEEDET